MSYYKEILEQIFSDLLSEDPKKIEEVRQFYDDLEVLLSRFPYILSPKDKEDILDASQLNHFHVYFYSLRIQSPTPLTIREAKINSLLTRKILKYYRKSSAHIKLWETFIFILNRLKELSDENNMEISPKTLYLFLVHALPSYQEYLLLSQSEDSLNSEICYVSVCLRELMKINWDNISFKNFVSFFEKNEASGTVH
ncbi:MAG: hypothetical protein QW478_03300 [Candidatus Micrarchaeaceae archaeon]